MSRFFRGLLGQSSDPVQIAWDSEEMHPQALEGDCFDDFANLTAWSDTLATRFPTAHIYSAGGSIDATTRPYNGKATYNLANGSYLQLQKDFGQAYPVLWMRARVFIPTNIGASFNRVFVLGAWDRTGADTTVVGSLEYNFVLEQWDNENDWGGSAGPSPDVPLAKTAILGAWHVLLMRCDNDESGGRPRYSGWIDGMFQFAQGVMYVDAPFNQGFQGLDMYFGLATAGDGIAMQMWEVVAGTDPYTLL